MQGSKYDEYNNQNQALYPNVTHSNFGDQNEISTSFVCTQIKHLYKRKQVIKVSKNIVRAELGNHPVTF